MERSFRYHYTPHNGLPSSSGSSEQWMPTNPMDSCILPCFYTYLFLHNYLDYRFNFLLTNNSPTFGSTDFSITLPNSLSFPTHLNTSHKISISSNIPTSYSASINACRQIVTSTIKHCHTVHNWMPRTNYEHAWKTLLIVVVTLWMLYALTSLHFRLFSDTMHMKATDNNGLGFVILLCSVRPITNYVGRIRTILMSSKIGYSDIKMRSRRALFVTHPTQFSVYRQSRERDECYQWLWLMNPHSMSDLASLTV